MAFNDLYAYHDRPGGILSTGLFVFLAILFWDRASHFFLLIGTCLTMCLGLVQLALVKETLQKTARYTPLNVLRNQEYGFWPRRWYDVTYYAFLLIATPLAARYGDRFSKNILSFWLGLSLGRSSMDVIMQVYHPLLWLGEKAKRMAKIAAAKFAKNESMVEMIKGWELGDYSQEPLLIRKILGSTMVCLLTDAQRKAISNSPFGVKKDPENADKILPIWSDIETMKASPARKNNDAARAVFLRGEELVQFVINAGYKQLVVNPGSSASYTVPAKEMVLFREGRWRLPPLTKALIPSRSDEEKRDIFNKLSKVGFSSPKVGDKILSAYFGSNIDLKIFLAFTSREQFHKSHLKRCGIMSFDPKRICEFAYIANYALLLIDPWTPDQITFDRQDIAGLLLHIDPKFDLRVIAPNPFTF